MKYSVIGLGKLGASMAAAIASRGYDVIGVDVLESTVNAINQGLAPIQETNLQETIADNKTRLEATLSHQKAIEETDISFVIVPTPSDEKGAFSSKYAETAFTKLAQALKEKDTYHLFVFTSTVLPGVCRTKLIPLIEQESGKICGKDFGFCYSPEFIALGSVIHDLLHPDFTLIGEFDSKSGDLLEEAYSNIVSNAASSRRMSIENAEITKIALNSFVTTKIAFANMLSEVCEKLPGGDVDIVSSALGSDFRISNKYLKGGLGFGGPCFPRDNVALRYIMEKIGVDFELPQSVHDMNQRIPDRLFNKIEELATKADKVALLGLAYKPSSHVIEESQSIQLAQMLLEKGVSLQVYDPLANEEAAKVLAGKVTFASNLKDCVKDANVVIVTTDDSEFKTIDSKLLTSKAGTVTVLDCWRILEKQLSDDPAVNYIAIGKSDNDQLNLDRLKNIWVPKEKKLAETVIVETDNTNGHAASKVKFLNTINSRSIAEDRTSYQAADPFPYLVLDNVLPKELVTAAMTQYPSKHDQLWQDHGSLYEVEGVARKYCLTDISQFPTPLKVIVDLLHSPEFIQYVEEVTGIEDLFCDPSLFGGGLNMVDEGGLLEVHADYNFNNDLGAYRCVNALVYLNDNWKREYGGALELWDKEQKLEPKVVLPTPGRILIFATNDETFHGYGPVKEPNQRTRNSINIYYHREQPAPNMSAKPHKTIWKDVGREKQQ